MPSYVISVIEQDIAEWIAMRDSGYGRFNYGGPISIAAERALPYHVMTTQADSIRAWPHRIYDLPPEARAWNDRAYRDQFDGPITFEVTEVHGIYEHGGVLIPSDCPECHPNA